MSGPAAARARRAFRLVRGWSSVFSSKRILPLQHDRHRLRSAGHDLAGRILPLRPVGRLQPMGPGRKLHRRDACQRLDQGPQTVGQLRVTDQQHQEDGQRRQIGNHLPGLGWLGREVGRLFRLRIEG